MADNDWRIDRAAERRASKRFPIAEEVFYRTLDHKAVSPENGIGKTVDISSSGILFATEQHLRCGRRIEVAVSWPAHLADGCPLKFVAVGRVVRAEDRRAAITIEQYEFRTRRKDLPAGTAPERTARPAPVPYH